MALEMTVTIALSELDAAKAKNTANFAYAASLVSAGIYNAQQARDFIDEGNKNESRCIKNLAAIKADINETRESSVTPRSNRSTPIFAPIQELGDEE